MDIAKIVASNALAVAVLGYVLKLWIEKRLGYEFDRQADRFRADLAKEVARDSIQQTWINNKRMELFAQLYEIMVSADFELKAFLINLKVNKPDLSGTRATNFCERYTALNAALHKNELFLPGATIEEIRSTYKPYFDLAIRYLDTSTTGPVDLSDSLPQDIEEIFRLGNMPRERAIKLFRRMSGIEMPD